MHAHFYLVNRVPFARYNFIDTIPLRKGKRHLLPHAFPLVRGLVAQKIQPSPERVRLHMMTFLLHLALTPVYGFRIFCLFRRTHPWRIPNRLGKTWPARRASAGPPCNWSGKPALSCWSLCCSSLWCSRGLLRCNWHYRVPSSIVLPLSRDAQLLLIPSLPMSRSPFGLRSRSLSWRSDSSSHR